MKKLITFFIQRPVTIIMITAAILLGGVVSFFTMPLDKMPEILFPQVTVETKYPGMNALDLKSMVTVPLEDAMSSVKGLERIGSISRDEVSLITLSFRWGTDPVNAAALVREAIDRAYPGLPFGVEKPFVVSGSVGDEPHAVVAVRSLAGDNFFARNLAEYEMKARLRQLDGTGVVIIAGGETREIQLRVNPDLLVSRNLNGDDFAELIARETNNIPAGNIREGDRELTVVSKGMPQSTESFSALVLPSNDGPVDLRRLARASEEAAAAKSYFLFNNEEQCALEIYRRPGADPIKFSSDIKKVLEQANKDFSRDAELTLVWDRAPSILESVKNLVVSALVSAIAVAVILALFIKHFRSGFLAALALPISAAASLVFLKLCGRSLNTMSLCGLAMGIGLVSDASVVVLDVFIRNIYPGRKPSFSDIGSLAASVSGSGFGGTVTTCIVFVPIVFFPGPLGALFGDLAVSLVASVIMGWIYSMFFLPTLFRFFYRKEPPVFSNGIERIYRPFLKKAFHRPKLFFAAGMAIILAGIFILAKRPLEFFTSSENTEIEVAMDFPSGTYIEAADDQAKRASLVLSKIESILSFYGKMGAEDEDIGRRADPSYRKERMLFRCFLRSGAKAEMALKEIQTSFLEAGIEETEINATIPSDRTGKLLGFSSAFSLMIKDDDPQTVYSRAELTAASIRDEADSFLAGINVRPSGTRPELRFIPDRYALAFSGISAAKIAGTVFTATEGVVTGNIEQDGRRIDVRVIGDMENFLHKNLEMFPLFIPSDEKESRVFLGSLGRIESLESQSALARQDRSDVVFMDLIPAAGRENNLREYYRELPDDILRADQSVFSRYKEIILVTIVVTVVLLYLVMAAQFESFAVPFIIMFNIPFALAGAGLMLLATRNGIDIGAVLGLIVLFGLTINNGIVLFEAGEERINRGCSPLRAVYDSALVRFRPILTSSLTTVVGLVPLLFSQGVSQRSMASAMMGGLLVSTTLTVFLMPPVFVALFSGRRKKND